MKIPETIVLHDAFAFKGGGERLIHILCRELESDLAFGHWSADSFNLTDLPGRLIDLESESGLPFWRTLKRFHAFWRGTRFLRNYQNVIYSGQNSVLAVGNHLEGRNIYYCNTPPRSIYDLKEIHLASQSAPRKLAHHLYNAFFQPLYENAIRKMDVIVANSFNIQNRIKKFLGLESVVIHPPCDTDQFRWIGQDDYYLSTARLLSYKRVDIIIQTFIQLPEKKLVVTSTGPEEDRLKKLAEGFSNILFTGDVSDLELKKLLGNAIATLYIPKEEDFGLSPVESMAAGKPVIGAGEGGLAETVIHGETGWLSSPNPSPEELVQAVRELGPKQALSMRSACEERARVFCTDIFIEKMNEVIG